jgi:hypothetical protein
MPHPLLVTPLSGLESACGAAHCYGGATPWLLQPENGELAMNDTIILFDPIKFKKKARSQWEAAAATLDRDGASAGSRLQAATPT